MYIEPKLIVGSQHRAEQKIFYFWECDGVTLEKTITNTGRLSSSRNVSTQDLIYLENSVGGINKVKFSDYIHIKEGLELFGKTIREYGKNNNIEYFPVACDKERESQGFRKLRPFEEEILLNALGINKLRKNHNTNK